MTGYDGISPRNLSNPAVANFISVMADTTAAVTQGIHV
jgi:hypothetical protein